MILEIILQKQGIKRENKIKLMKIITEKHYKVEKI